jgi:Tol biopolymer transport system component
VLFTRFPRGGGGRLPDDIYSVAVDGSDERRLTSNPANDEEPQRSPDGRTIAFFSSRDVHDQLYLMNADGSDQRRLLETPFDDREPSWSPDGEFLVFSRYSKDRVEIWSVKRDGTGAERLTLSCAVTYEYSPSDLCRRHAPSPTWRR